MDTIIIGRKALQVEKGEWRYPGEDAGDAAASWAPHVRKAHFELGSLINVDDQGYLSDDEDAYQIMYTANALGIFLGDIAEGEGFRGRCIAAIRQVAAERRSAGFYGARDSDFVPGVRDAQIVSGRDKARQWVIEREGVQVG